MKHRAPLPEERIRPAPARSRWLPGSHILAVILGAAFIGGAALYVIRHGYQTNLDFWRSELGASVRYQTWILQNSLQQSQDDAQLLAEFPHTKTLLISKGESGGKLSSQIAVKTQVISLFEEYRKIYEYGAVYLFDENGQVAASTTDSRLSKVVDTPKFKEVFGSVIRNRRYAVVLRREFGKELALIFLMPVFADPSSNPRAGGPAPSQSPIGVVVVIDLFNRDLLPLLAARNVVTHTGQTILLQLEGGEWRYGSGAAVGAPASDTLLRAASTAVERRPVFGQFVDNRGIRVLAAIERIQSISSTVVCKVDSDEAFADFRAVSRIELVTAVAIFAIFLGLVLMHSRRTVALEMRAGLARQQLVTQELETTVAQRTHQLADANQQLHRELADRLTAEEGLGEKVKMLNLAEVERERLIASLGGALSEKTVLLQEVHHRVKNNMAVIAGLLALQAETLQNEQARTALEESQRRVLSMAMIHEYLYATENLDRVNFGKYVHQLANDLLASYSIVSDSVDLVIEAEEIELPVDRAIPCALILNELLSNALKYAFPAGRRGGISVRFGRLPSGELSLSCQDDGVGIPGTYDWRNPHSLGLRIVSILTKQINGELVLGDRVHGTGFELRSPLSERVWGLAATQDGSARACDVPSEGGVTWDEPVELRPFIRCPIRPAPDVAA